MKKTTRVKLALKKHLPTFLFSVIYISNKWIVSKIRSFSQKSNIDNFTNEEVVQVVYFENKFNLVVNPKNKGIDHELFLKGSYEPEIMFKIKENIEQGDTVIDVGANIGHHAIFMALCVGEKGCVFAFEPIPSLYEQFCKSIKLNNVRNIQIFKEALGNSEKKEKIYIDEDNVATSSIVKSHSVNNEHLVISVKTLDSFNIVNPKFIKIDVEGYEYNVLQGGKITIETYHPTIVMEYSPLFYREYDKTHSRKIIEFLRENHYLIYDLEDGNREVTNDEDFINSFGEYMRSQTNILCKYKFSQT